jgi:hypothetical protein
MPIKIDSQINDNPYLQQLESKLKLPVVVTRAGTTFVLDLHGRGARILPAGLVSRPRRLAGFAKPRADASLLSPSTKSARKRRILPLRLFLQYPEVSAKSAKAAVKRLAAISNKLKAVHISIETGPVPPDWGKLQKFVSMLLDSLGKYKIPAALTIEGAFRRPEVKIMDWLGRQNITTRFILGPASGFPAELDGDAAEALATMSEYGMRTPVLFYWSGQSAAEVAGVLKNALCLNKLAGVGILPYFLSHRFNCKIPLNNDAAGGFLKVIESLYADRQLSEFLEEPISDIEERLMGSQRASCANTLITKSGRLLAFRRFPFAAALPRTKKSRFRTPLAGCCKQCAWRCICGGVDKAPAALGPQHKAVIETWCLYRKNFMRRIAVESLDIRQQLNQIKGSLLRNAG